MPKISKMSPAELYELKQQVAELVQHAQRADRAIDKRLRKLQGGSVGQTPVIKLAGSTAPIGLERDLSTWDVLMPDDPPTGL